MLTSFNVTYIYSPEHYSSESYSSPGTSQQQYQEQSGNFDNQAQFEAPMTPAATNMRITRNTRARMRGTNGFIFNRLFYKKLYKY